MTFIDKQHAQGAIDTLNGVVLDTNKPHMKVRCELNLKQSNWKPPSSVQGTNVSLSFNSKNIKKRKKGDGSHQPACYRYVHTHSLSLSIYLSEFMYVFLFIYFSL